MNPNKIIKGQSAELKRALSALKVIRTWAIVDAKDEQAPKYWKAAMLDIANMAAKGLGRDDLVSK